MMDFQWFAALVLIAMSVLALLYHNRLKDAVCVGKDAKPVDTPGNCMNEMDKFQFAAFIAGIVVGSLYLGYDLLRGSGIAFAGRAGSLRGGFQAQM
jgi:hypothetical protein